MEHTFTVQLSITVEVPDDSTPEDLDYIEGGVHISADSMVSDTEVTSSVIIPEMSKAVKRKAAPLRSAPRKSSHK